MEVLTLVTRLWCLHAALALPFVAPLAWLVRKRLQWSWWEGLVFLVPFSAWASLMFGDWIKRPKSLGNLGEFWLISVVIVAAATARGVLGTRADGTGVRVLILAATAAAGVGVYLLTPMWPE